MAAPFVFVGIAGILVAVLLGTTMGKKSDLRQRNT